MLALVAPGAVAIGLSLGMLGSGGSILTVPVLVYLVGQPEKVAIAGSLAVVGIISLVSAVPYIRDRLVDWRNVVFFGLPGMAGTYLGAWSSAYVSGAVQLSVFAAVMLAAAWFMLRPFQAQPGSPTVRSAARVASDGLAVGALTGFVGVGGGFLVVPALVLLGGLSMHRAVATSLVIIALKSASGFVKYVDVLDEAGLALDADVIVLVSMVGVVGSLAGVSIARRMATEKLKSWFGMFLIAMGLVILAQSLPGALG